jgi:hypothetical protein
MTAVRALALGVALVVSACGTSSAPDVTVRAEGRDVILDGNRPLRAVLVDLEWDPSLTVNAITAAADAERMNLLRVELAATTARVLLTDTRRIRLPERGTLLHVDATGDGEIRIVAVEIE